MSARPVRFLGEYIGQKSAENEFDRFITNLLQNINLETNLPIEVNLQLSKNIFEFLNIISQLDYNSIILLALGFAYTEYNIFQIIGKEYLINKLTEFFDNQIIKNVNINTIEKTYFFLLHSKKDNLIAEKSLNDLSETSQIQGFNLNQNNPKLIERILNELNQVMMSNEWPSQNSVTNPTDKNAEKDKSVDKINKQLEFPSFNPCNDIHIEKLVYELGPAILNIRKDNFNKPKSGKNSVVVDNPALNLYDFNINEKRLAELIIFICNNYNYQEEKEQRLLLKLFLKNVSNELSQQVEDNLEKRINLSWNIEAFYKANKQKIEIIDPKTFFSYLDNPNFSILDKKTYENFNTIILKLNLPNLLFNTLFCNGAWTNIDNQLSTIEFLLNNPNDLIKSSSNNNMKRGSACFDFSTLKTSNQVFLGETWSNFDVVGGLLKIGQGDHMFKVKSLFSWPIANMPEIILLELFQLPKDSFLYTEIIKDLIPGYISNFNNTVTLLEELWILNKERFIETLSFLYETMPEVVNLNKILDLTQKIKDSLLSIVSSNYDYFSISIATLAIKRDFLHIDQWLRDRIENRGDDFIIPLLDFIKTNVINEYKKKMEGNLGNPTIKTSLIKQNKYTVSNTNNTNYMAIKEQILEKSQLTIEAIAIIFEHLSFNSIQYNHKISKQTMNEISIIYKQIFEIFDELHSHPQSSVETEEKANLLFRKLFNDETSIKSLTEQMKQFKESDNKKDNEVFACMLHSMLDEYRFFIKYPDKELNLMGCLFGQIIDLRLIDGVIESIALRYIIEGFKKQQGKLIIFSVKAVEQFINKIVSWPLFLEELYKTTRSFQGEIYDRIAEKYQEYMKITETIGVNQNSVIGASQQNFNLNTNPNTGNNLQNKMINMQGMNNMMGMIPQPLTKSGTKTNKFNSPNDNVIIGNMGNINNINNLNNFQYPSVYNMGTNYIPPEKSQLNANQMPFNPSTVTYKQGGTKLNKELNYNTNITLIKKVYSSDVKFKENVGSQIVALKNLAVSLSQVTLLKNKPLLSKDINLKDMILEAYQSGKLLIAVAFVCKFLEQSAKSKIFHNKNPWIVSILSLLSEISKNKLAIKNIKSEVEELFKKLELDITKHPSANLTSKLKYPSNSPDFITPPKQATLSMMEARYEEIIALMEEYKIDQMIGSLCEGIKSQVNSKELEKHCKSKTELNQETFTKENLIKIFAQSLLNAINQILFLVVERTINISLTTTRELVMKDFAFDPDAEKFMKAVILSVKNLSGSLANVTCKDPLRQGFLGHVKDQLSKSKLDMILEMVKNHLTISKIIDVGCLYIKEYVVTKSIEKAEKDEILVEECRKRQSGEFLKSTTNENDYSYNLQQKMLSLPPILRPNNNVGVVPDPIKIYEDFEKLNISKE